MVEIIVKNYEHFNRGLPNWNSKKGKYISSKRQYTEECKKAGLVSYTEPTDKKVALKPSSETVAFLRSVKNRTDNKGNVKLSGSQVAYMIKIGAIKDRDKMKYPTDYKKGGFG
jgi:hypothetical protein